MRYHKYRKPKAREYEAVQTTWLTFDKRTENKVSMYAFAAQRWELVEYKMQTGLLKYSQARCILH